MPMSSTPRPRSLALGSLISLAVVLVLALIGASRLGAQEGRVPVVGGPCEGCEAVFVGMPEALSWRARIALEDEPGEPMALRGTVYDVDGSPATGVIVYAYHTDATGVYPPAEELQGHARRHGELRGWARTDARGRYRFDTIRPASYPSRDTPAHVHMHVIEPDCCTYWIDSIHFTDDPLLPARERDASGTVRGGPGLVTPEREDGVWVVTRDIHLGRGVPGYPAR